MAFPNPHLNDPGQAVEAATRGNRFLARLIDGIVFFAPFPFLILGLPGVVAAIGLLLAILAWQLWLLVTRGQTIGKKYLGIYIMRSDGELPNIGWLLVREVAIPATVALFRYAGHNDPSPVGHAFQIGLYFVGVIDCLFIFGPTRRCLHDLVAGTHVVVA